MSFDLTELRDAVSVHGVVGRIVIAAHAGSAPRESGTSMLVWATGQSGTIGGGALEFKAVQMLRKALQPGKTTVERLPLGPALGQCCGGAVTLVSEVFDASTLPEDAPSFTRRCSGTHEHPLAIKRAQANARNGHEMPEILFENGWLSEAVQPARMPLWIYGAGHVGRAIVAATAPLPQFQITWIDTAPGRFPTDILQGVTVLPTPKPASAVALAPADAQHLILTYSHALDLELCHQILSRSFAGAGLIGSKTKWARFQNRLAALGHTQQQINRITCPIGDPALGKHPQAIALGVASRLVLDAHHASAKGRQATA